MSLSPPHSSPVHSRNRTSLIATITRPQNGIVARIITRGRDGRKLPHDCRTINLPLKIQPTDRSLHGAKIPARCTRRTFTRSWGGGRKHYAPIAPTGKKTAGITSGAAIRSLVAKTDEISGLNGSARRIPKRGIRRTAGWPIMKQAAALGWLRPRATLCTRHELK